MRWTTQGVVIISSYEPCTRVPSRIVPSLCAKATCAAPRPALAAALVLGTTRLATIDALAAAAVTPVEARRAHLRAHRVAPVVALVALLVAPIPLSLPRIRRPLPNASSLGAIVACRRKLVMMIVLLLFLQKQKLATAIYLFRLGTLLSRLELKHMRIRSHHDLAGTLVTPLLL